LDILLVPEERKSVKNCFQELKQVSSQTSTRILGSERRHSLLHHVVEYVSLDNKGEVEFIIGTGIDITAQRQAEEKLKTAYGK